MENHDTNRGLGTVGDQAVEKGAMPAGTPEGGKAPPGGCDGTDTPANETTPVNTPPAGGDRNDASDR